MSYLQDQVGSLLQTMDAECKQQEKKREELLNLSDHELSTMGLDGLIDQRKLAEYKADDAERDFARDAAKDLLYNGEPRKATSLSETMAAAKDFRWNMSTEEMSQGLLDCLKA